MYMGWSECVPGPTTLFCLDERHFALGLSRLAAPTCLMASQCPCPAFPCGGPIVGLPHTEAWPTPFFLLAVSLSVHTCCHWLFPLYPVAQLAMGPHSLAAHLDMLTCSAAWPHSSLGLNLLSSQKEMHFNPSTCSVEHGECVFLRGELLRPVLVS